MRCFYICLLLISAAVAQAQGHTPSQKIWIFETRLTGASNQRMAIAERLGSDIEVLTPPGEYEAVSPLEYLHKYLGDRFSEPSAWPDYVINTEEWPHEINLMLEIRKLSPKKTKVIHLENPKLRNLEFDLIVNATHQPLIKGSNVIRLTGVSSWITDMKLQAARAKWETRLGWMKKPLILVSIGGESEFNPYHSEYAKDLAQKVKAVAKTYGASVLIVTSRRTPPAAVETVVRELTGIVYFLFDWNRDLPDDNPYAAGLALADYVIVTGDSLSMMSDVAAVGKPLYIHAPNGSLRPEHPRMIEDLYIQGIARPFTGNELQQWTYTPINIADTITEAIRKRFCQDALEGN